MNQFNKKKQELKLLKISIYGFLICLTLFSAINNLNYTKTYENPESASEFGPPTIIGDIKFEIDGEETEGKVTTGETITIKLIVRDDCQSIKFYLINTEFYNFPEVYFNKVDSTHWEYELDTSSFNNVVLAIGKYDFQFVLSNGDDENAQGADGYTFSEALNVVKPIPWTLIIGIAGGVVGIGVITGIIMLKKKRDEERILTTTSRSTKRKRQIYSGASQIGRMDGRNAEVLMEKRQKRSTPSYNAQRSMNFKKTSKPTSPKTQSVDINKLPSSVQVKLEESKVGVLKRTKFLDSKIEVLRSQIILLNSIIPEGKEVSECPICSKSISKSWEICPYCKLEEQKDEINLKHSMTALNAKKVSVCRKCGLVQDPSWIKCPKCFIESNKQN